MESLNKKEGSDAANVTQGLYHKMVSEVQDYALLLLDCDGNILNWNPGAQKIKGYASDEIIGKNFRVFYSKEDRAQLLPDTLLRTAYEKGRAAHEGFRLKKDGSTFWGSVVITALHDDNDQVIGYCKVTRDLTERKNAEDELQHQNELLRRSEERYHRMIAEVEDYAIILLDPDGNIMNWNKGAQKIKGYTEAEIVGRNFRNFYRVEDRERQLPEQLLALAVANNKSAHEGWRLRKDGSHFWGSVVITALHDNHGNITGFSKVTRDLTYKKQSDDLILQQNKQLEEYAYVASHDLQEPLRKIMLFIDLLQRNIDDKEAVASYITKINASTQRMSTLIKAVLNYSQATDDVELKAAVDLNVVLAHIETDFDVLLSERSGVLKRTTLPVVHAVPIQMHQLFSNFVSNAIKFNDGFPVINITYEDSTKSGRDGFIKITVKDNGRGFDPEQADKIFRMFHRLHDKTQGTGIGLALCKRIAENHGGTITVSTSPGQGTAFEIWLPDAILV
ncbi:PAS domain-containing sensor histidine kinase [Flavobacterium magnum]|uniref:histidine kinase n=1 Tax=Flavobacterium magnum TaxID=2162713 RepID=A0A2S0REV1_9FLAO|nr:PAS domain-containing sensor histidine kinase [Flavobacterium magnum]AWA30206.1 PAS domain-containing sensor histidine kinase [Flavobacterium magnum]